MIAQKAGKNEKDRIRHTPRLRILHICAPESTHQLFYRLDDFNSRRYRWRYHSDNNDGAGNRERKRLRSLGRIIGPGSRLYHRLGTRRVVDPEMGYPYRVANGSHCAIGGIHHHERLKGLLSPTLFQAK